MTAVHGRFTRSQTLIQNGKKDSSVVSLFEQFPGVTKFGCQSFEHEIRGSVVEFIRLELMLSFDELC